MSFITPMIMKSCYDSGLSHEESSDIYGQVAYVLLRNLDNLRSDNKFFSYLKTIVRSEIAGLYRKRQLEEKASAEVVKALYKTADRSPEQEYQSLVNTEILLEAIARLPEKQARLIRAMFLEPGEPSYEELSERLNMPISSIGPTRSRGLMALYRILRHKGYEF